MSSNGKKKKKGTKKKPTGKKKTDTKKTKTKTQAVKRIVMARKGEDVHIKKLVVQPKEIVEIDHGGGTLKIDSIEVKKGGQLIHDLGKLPKGFVIGKISGSGNQSFSF